jgi:hypothetical protein
MAGQRTSAKPITTATRFLRGIELLHAPEDGIVFVDWRALVGGLRKLLRAGEAKAGLPYRIEALVILDRITQRLDILDYTVGVQWTEGRRESFNAITALQPEAMGKRLAKVKASRPPLQDPLSMVPVEADGFHASAGWDFGELYSLLLHIVGEDVPNGQTLLAEWMMWQDKIGFNIEYDVLSWISGEFITVTVPAANPGPFWSSDLVVMLRVSDSELATRKLDAGIRRLQALFQKRLNQSLNVAPATRVRARGFRTVSMPMLAMLPAWTLGVQGDWLIAGTSPDSVGLCLATAAGRHPSVVKSPRFQAEGIRVAGSVQSVSFTELGDHGAGMAQGFLVANFYAGMIAGMTSEKKSDAPAPRPFQGMMRLLTRLQPVFAQIDFMSSSATVTTFDGSAWRTDSVVNYQAPDPQP